MPTKKRAVFLDRDGTIARDVPYCSRTEDFEMFDTVKTGVELLKDKGFVFIVITNQSGIGRGYFTEDALARIHRKMKDTFESYGAGLLDIYYCPHHPDDSCDCRKPEPGMVIRAAREHDIDLSRSFFVGDMWLDVAAGQRAGCKTVLVPSGQPESPGKEITGVKADYIAGDFVDACRWIAGSPDN